MVSTPCLVKHIVLRYFLQAYEAIAKAAEPKILQAPEPESVAKLLQTLGKVCHFCGMSSLGVTDHMCRGGRRPLFVDNLGSLEVCVPCAV